LDTTVAGATQELRVLTLLLQSLLDEKTIAALKRSVDELQEIMGTLIANNERLDSLIVNAERDSRDIRLLLDEKTIASVKRSVDGLQELMATLSANNQRLGSLIVNAERDSRGIGPLLETSNATLRELRTQVLPRFYEAIGDLDGLSHSLNGLANRITRDPSVVIRGTAAPPGPGER
jgi:phospholipid/cholesterol/gamma-HCH transport system substrate-binding protein